jgi:hypothetical protein
MTNHCAARALVRSETKGMQDAIDLVGLWFRVPRHAGVACTMRISEQAIVDLL